MFQEMKIYFGMSMTLFLRSTLSRNSKAGARQGFCFGIKVLTYQAAGLHVKAS